MPENNHKIKKNMNFRNSNPRVEEVRKEAKACRVFLE